MEEVLPRLYRVVVPLPDNPLKEINSYILTSNDRNLIIDTGMNRPECREALERGLAAIGVDLARTDFMATHLHSDHQGLIPTLKSESSDAYMGERDALQMKGGSGLGFAGGPMGEYAARSGFSEEELNTSLQEHPGHKYGPAGEVDYIHLRGDEILEVGDYRLVSVSTPGHTDGHMCLYEPEKRLLFSGDHVLGDITPNIQAWSDENDPLDMYLKSLEKVVGLDVELCLPGHRSFITDFSGRVAELLDHHRVRRERGPGRTEGPPEECVSDRGGNELAHPRPVVGRVPHHAEVGSRRVKRSRISATSKSRDWLGVRNGTARSSTRRRDEPGSDERVAARGHPARPRWSPLGHRGWRELPAQAGLPA